MSAPAAGPSEDLPIDVELIKVLAADSRRDILRLLGERRKTLTELAAALDLKKATVLEHLKKLTDAGLIRRLDEDERLWVYYELTPRGRRIVTPNRTRFYLLLAGSAAAVLVLGAVLVAALGGLGSFDDVGTGAPQPSQETVQGGARPLPPVVVWRGLDADVPIESGFDREVEGTMLVLSNGDERASLAYANGTGTLDAATLDALPRGAHALALRTPAGTVMLQRTLDVREPIGALTPLVVVEGRAANLTMLLGQDAPAEVDVRVEGARVAGVRTGDSLSVPLGPQRVGNVTVEVGRLLAREVRVVPDVALAFEGSSLRATRAGAPLADATVLVDGVVVATTDADGRARLDAPAPGEHALRLVAPDGAAVDWSVRSDGATLARAPARIALDAFDARAGSPDLRVRATLRNDGPAPALVTLTVESAGRALAATLVELSPGASTSTLLEAPAPAAGPLEAVARVMQDDVSALEPAAGAGSSPDAVARDGVVARVRLVTPTATMPTASASPYGAPEPAVPGPGLALALAAVLVAAWAMRRRRA